MKYICANCNKEYPVQANQVRETIIRAIRDATRWSAVQEAISAMLTIELMASSMLAEHQKHHCKDRNTGTMVGP